jgi:UDP-2,4-diacetamido-2,4,6-trideoxy-beta-L-altropyranose hydrolase
MRIVFRVDSSPLISGGHVMRCLALADRLAAAGHDTRFERSGHALARIPAMSPAAGERWDRDIMTDADQSADAAAFRTEVGEGADWIVVDHYRLDARWERAARGGGSRLLVLDDLASRPHDCDLLLDPTLGRAAEDYRGHVPADCRLLLGPAFALLGPGFAAERPAALERRRTMGPVTRILVSLGSGDDGGSGEAAAAAAAAAFPEATIDRAGGATPVEPQQMAALMRDADLAIGAGGTTSWERCCLGLPSIVLPIADNQRLIVKRLAAAGVALAIAGVDQLTAALHELADPATRAPMAAAAFAICDGEGIGRAVAAMLELGSREAAE